MCPVRTIELARVTAQLHRILDVLHAFDVTRDFNRATDELILEWPKTAGARSYLVRVESPLGPRTFFTEETRVRLAAAKAHRNMTMNRRKPRM